MWFASIWIFTLRLPWALGADFFLRHLLDGDPASNTLSWRWVAGLHTRGKCYVARADNIARYTGGRFNPVGQLDEAPEPLTEDGTLPEPHLPTADDLPAGAFALLLHDEDCCAESLLAARGTDIVTVGAVTATPLVAAHGVAAPVAAFARGALDDAVGRLGRPAERLAPEAVAEWVARQRCPVVALAAPAGPTAELLAGLPVRQVRRAWDTVTWPHARHGYFRMREHVPSILESVISAPDAGSAIRFVHELSA
jgi:deoxyribodipyrimidine photo-lyase